LQRRLSKKKARTSVHRDFLNVHRAGGFRARVDACASRHVRALCVRAQDARRALEADPRRPHRSRELSADDDHGGNAIQTSSPLNAAGRATALVVARADWSAYCSVPAPTTGSRSGEAHVKMVYVLVAAATAAAIAGATSFAGSVPSSGATTPAAAISMDTPAAPTGAVEADEGTAVEGEVLELIDVPSYTYLRLGARGTEGTWAAVSTASIKVGDHVRVAGATKMPGFTSTTLKRTFPIIYFGTLAEGGSRAPSAADPFNAPANPHAGGADPHQAPSGRAAVDVKKVGRAPGPNGKTVAEVIAERVKLAGKTIRVQGTVVKSTTGVLGRTYLHVQDGSGDAAAGTHDISVTTTATPSVGEVITIEGVVTLDQDIGSGYTFPTLIADARIL
jgi:hypothetical protein